MEQLLHYIWKHKIFPLRRLETTDGLSVEVIDPGLHNGDAGPDFFNAKVRIGGTMWVGNIEIHDRSSDWYTHGHHRDSRYDNVILHIAATIDSEVRTSNGNTLPQMRLEVPRACRQTTSVCCTKTCIRPATSSFPTCRPYRYTHG